MSVGDYSWLGEQGPELARATPGGFQIYSNPTSMRMAGKGGDTHIHINVTAPPSMGYSPKQSQRAIAEAVGNHLQGLLN